MKKLLLIFILFTAAVILQGCLSVETKEYSFKIKKDGSGTGKIRFINIMTDSKDSLETVENDYQDLINNYLNGHKFEDDYPKIKNVKKKLFEEDDQLTGEITFDFDNLSDLKFYRYEEKGPWTYYLGGSPMGMFGTSETYFSSNGKWGGENMPVIFWDNDQREFEFKTTVKAPDNNSLSLIGIWRQKEGK